MAWTRTLHGRSPYRLAYRFRRPVFKRDEPWQARRRRVAFWSRWLPMSDRGPLSPYPETPSGEIDRRGSGPTPLPFVDPERDLDAVREVAAARRALLAEIGKRIVGQERVIDHLLIALFARGHCLFVGVPGLAKTLLISTLAEALALSFERIQFTPDLMPSDITGTDVLEEDRATGRRVFRFVRGPIFAQPRARRRDQPHAAQDAGGAAAVDAGVPRDGGRADLRAAAAVPGVRDAEPDRAGGHLPAARGAARSLHVPGRRRLPVGRGGGRASSTR